MVFELGVSWVKSRGPWQEGGHVVNLRYAHLRCEPTALPPPPPAPPGQRVESAARPITPALHSPRHGGRPRRNVALLSLRRSGDTMMHGPCYNLGQRSRAGYHTRNSLSAAPRAFLNLSGMTR
eukprot:152300-Chlamydomonas_euryale.AAC.1